MDLSIIIVNWNTRELLAECLRSVYADAGDLALEVIVVDNASRDGSVEMVREQFPQVRLIANSENVGFARANNQGMRESAGRYVVLLNSDTEVKPGAWAALVRMMDAHPEAGAAGPYLLNADGSLQPSCHPVLTPGRELWRLLFLERILSRATYPMERWDTTQPHRVEVIKGACLLLRRAALDQVGLLDERYFMYTEEMDLCHRIGQAGWLLYWVPQARVVHYGGASTRQMAEAMYLELYRSKIQFQRKFWGDGRARWFKALLYLAYGPRWLVTSVARLWNASLAPRARTYRQLLARLPAM
ncbi:MAG: glycosyltransferase family 2 protein [Chloroflexi bacterium]|nr:glycosyltransferase family 2 protein [Chloroflexota bacterium]